MTQQGSKNFATKFSFEEEKSRFQDLEAKEETLEATKSQRTFDKTYFMQRGWGLFKVQVLPWIKPKYCNELDA